MVDSKLMSNCNFPDHPFKDITMKWEDRIPVNSSPYAQRPESCRLYNLIVIDDTELKPGFAGEFHLSVQEQPFF